MRNSNCTVCLKEFAPREGKLYCSNACKQKGFNDNKQLELKSNEINKEKEIRKVKMEFYFKDFQEFRKLYPDSINTFILFCFFRRNLQGIFIPDLFQEYLNSFSNNFWESFWNDDYSKAKTKYADFEMRFFSDDTIINLS